MKSYPILYARASTGAVQQWQIFVDGDQFWTEAGQVGGAITSTKPTRCKGKNPGKANETSAEQQSEKEADAKFKKKKRENYFENIEDIDKGFLEPQLAKPGADYIPEIDWSEGWLVDDKLNGFACIITAKGAFTRTNKQYHAIPHILEEFAEILKENPYAYIQGELFNPDYVNNLGALSELISVVRQPKDITPELLAESKRIVQFHWYDGYNLGSLTTETPLAQRRECIDFSIVKNRFKYITNVPYERCYSFDAAKRYADKYIAQGGEGVIFKNPKAEYQHKRTRDLLKYKKQEDAEFRVVDDVQNPFEEGKGNSEGCAEAVWVYLNKPATDGRDRFKVNIEGPKDRLREMYKHPEKYKAQWVTVRFQEYSPYGIPLIPYTDMVMREQVEGKGSVNAGAQKPLDTSWLE